MQNNVTRGHGFLEKFLSHKRASMANKHIPDNLRDGRILDLGCGFYPYFLSTVKFKDKFGLNSIFAQEQIEGLYLTKYEFNANSVLPFADSFFNVITMLAVAEHLEPKIVANVFKEANRILSPGGRFLITVPWGQADLFLRFLSKIKLVSSVEIDEHKQFYSHKLLKQQLLSVDFKDSKIIVKRFELGLNLFVLAEK